MKTADLEVGLLGNKNVNPVWRFPRIAVAGLSALATSAAAKLSYHLFQGKSQTETGTQEWSLFGMAEFAPREGVESVLVKPGPVGPLMAPPGPLEMLLGPNCVFTYGNQLQNIDVAFVTGANVEEAWLYGARMEGDKGIVTGNSGDVIKGKALCWSKLLFKDKLQHVDGKQGYNVAAPEQGRSRRQQGKVVKRDGSALPAFFYFPNIGGAASASSSYELVSLVQKPAHSYRKALLLDNNGGVWSGSFIKLDGNGREMERWTTRLDVTEAIDGTIYAALTNTITGEVRSMNFQEPPNEMQLTNQGHWTLGPEAIGPFAWISELCLTNPAKGERRRAVIRHTGTGLEWFTMVWENRPGLPNVIPPSAPIQASYTLIGDRQVWTLEPGLELITMHTRKQGAPHEVGLRWRPEPTSSWLEVFRRHNEYGTLQPVH